MKTKFITRPFAEERIKTFIQLLKNPSAAVPAGGSSISLSAATAVALTELTFQISSKEWSDEVKSELQPLADKLAELENLLLELMTEDAEAYHINQEDKFKNNEKRKMLVKTPQKIAEAVNRAVKINYQLTPHIKKLLISDLKVAAYSLQSCQQGAVEIIKTNLNFFDYDEEFKENIETWLSKLK